MILTNKRFLILLIISHLGFVGLMIFGSILQIAIAILVSMFITLFSSTIVYHRLLSHRSWNAPYWYEVFGTVIGIFSFTGTPITRTLAHRYHHAYTETTKDPHSPRVHGVFLSYLPMLKDEKLNPVLVRDLLNHPLHRFIHENYLNIILTTIACSLIIIGPLWTVTLFIAPGTLCWMNISICNIGCHWGKGDDPIKQSKLLAWLTFGEGYHKHHHDVPNDPNFGKDKFDIGYFFIKLLEKK
jgi:fatty-acid desaturase